MRRDPEVYAMSSRSRTTPTSTTKKSARGWRIAALVLGPILLGAVLARWSPVATVLTVLAVAGLGLFALIARPVPALGLRTRVSGLAVIGMAMLLIIGGGAAAASNAQDAPTARPNDSTSRPQALVDTGTAAPAQPTAAPTTFDTSTEEVAVPFQQTTIDDPQRDKGTTAIVTAGVAGVKTIVYKITLVNGIETSREKVSEAITTPPIDEVTAIGSKPPAPVAAPLVQQGNASCDPNYSGACVPIATDVDCAGGGGDGPAYVQGPVRVTGRDIYKLDRDGDGIACD